MNYRINIAKSGKHFFATARQSITSKAKMERVYSELLSKFPESDGYFITVSVIRELHSNIDVRTISKADESK
jgi:hypothetical protein